MSNNNKTDKFLKKLKNKKFVSKMESPSIESQRPYNLRKRKRSPACKDEKENEKLPRSKIPRRVKKCLPVLPAESKITRLNLS